jgi:hypothetical protein
MQGCRAAVGSWKLLETKQFLCRGRGPRLGNDGLCWDFQVERLSEARSERQMPQFSDSRSHR